MSSGSRHQARQAAVQALYQWDLTEQDPADILKHFIRQHDLRSADQDYFHVLVRGIPLYRQEILDHLVPYLDRDWDDVDPVERAILRIGTYELEYQPDVPTNVVIDEAVELAKVFGSDHSYRYVNGVLDKVASQLRKPGLRGFDVDSESKSSAPSLRED